MCTVTRAIGVEPKISHECPVSVCLPYIEHGLATPVARPNIILVSQHHRYDAVCARQKADEICGELIDFTSCPS